MYIYIPREGDDNEYGDEYCSNADKHIYMYTVLYIWTHIDAYIHIYTYLERVMIMNMAMNMRVRMLIYIYMYTVLHIWIHINIYIWHIHIYTYIPRTGDDNEYGDEYGSKTDAEDPDDTSEPK
jgi:hypothetical protein